MRPSLCVHIREKVAVVAIRRGLVQLDDAEAATITTLASGGRAIPVQDVPLDGEVALIFPTMLREPFGFSAIEAAARGCVPLVIWNRGDHAMSDVLYGRIDLQAIGREAMTVVSPDFDLTRRTRSILLSW